jgi:hypothetical protein
MTPMQRLLEWEILPHEKKLIELHASGKIAVVVSPDLPAEEWERLGGNGDSMAFAIAEGFRRDMAADCRQRGDAVTVRWLKGDRSVASST